MGWVCNLASIVNNKVIDHEKINYYPLILGQPLWSISYTICTFFCFSSASFLAIYNIYNVSASSRAKNDKSTDAILKITLY